MYDADENWWKLKGIAKRWELIGLKKPPGERKRGNLKLIIRALGGRGSDLNVTTIG
jgi:hypothetical protein